MLTLPVDGLILIAVEGLPYAEVAQVFGIPIGILISRLFRVHERLRRSLDRRHHRASARPERPRIRGESGRVARQI